MSTSRRNSKRWSKLALREESKIRQEIQDSKIVRQFANTKWYQKHDKFSFEVILFGNMKFHAQKEMSVGVDIGDCCSTQSFVLSGSWNPKTQTSVYLQGISTRQPNNICSKPGCSNRSVGVPTKMSMIFQVDETTTNYLLEESQHCQIKVSRGQKRRQVYARQKLKFDQNQTRKSKAKNKHVMRLKNRDLHLLTET